jgi:hypothetical protein
MRLECCCNREVLPFDAKENVVVDPLVHGADAVEPENLSCCVSDVSVDSSRGGCSECCAQVLMQPWVG